MNWLVRSSEGGGIKEYFGSLDAGMIALFVGPFALLLGALAILPLFANHFWEKNKNKAMISLGLAIPIALFYFIKDGAVMVHTALDYGAFIALLSALFIISGGIYIRGSFAGRPMVNTAFLSVGALLANFIGTTGASMLLIRPLLRANRLRERKAHIVIFFIFIVSNCAGLLTPLGDPPLFLGFLKGVPFAWTLQLWPQWLFMTGALLLAFFFFDQYQFDKEDLATKGSLVEDVTRSAEPFGIEGKHNFLFLAAVVALIVFSGYVVFPMHGAPILGEEFGAVVSKVVQMVGMAAIAFLSFKITSRETQQKNNFGFGPIVEVAVLFAGIFVTMVPALMILETQGSKLGVKEPWQFFWMTGLLSSFLDNAPTYMTYSTLAMATVGSGSLEALTKSDLGGFLLAAVSCGAVLMGANTYIGNGPNFMVKAIAEENKVKMPSFFGYMVWSMAILIPLFAAVTLLFFL